MLSLYVDLAKVISVNGADYLQYGAVIWPPYESTHKPPKTTGELQKEIERLRLERQTRRGTVEPTIPFPNNSEPTRPEPSSAQLPLHQQPATERLV
jgi:hypothetical protein